MRKGKQEFCTSSLDLILEPHFLWNPLLYSMAYHLRNGLPVIGNPVMFTRTSTPVQSCDGEVAIVTDPATEHALPG
jgi:hypothetical protein